LIGKTLIFQGSLNFFDTKLTPKKQQVIVNPRENDENGEVKNAALFNTLDIMVHKE